MNRLLLFDFLLLPGTGVLSAQTWSVSGTGNDGKTPETAFR